jgi:hypothetical protein
VAKKLSPDVLGMLEFVTSSAPGDPLVYGTAAKGLRRSTRDMAWRLHEGGYVHLVQRRGDNGMLRYIMIRSGKTLIDRVLQQLV